MLSVLVSLGWACFVVAQEPTNLLKPTADTGSWNMEALKPAEGSAMAKDREIQFVASKVDGTDWHVQVFQTDLNLVEGERYTVKFRVRSPDNRGYSLRAMIDVEDYHEIGLRQELFAAKHFREESFTFTAKGVVPGKCRIGFVLGDEKGTLIIKNMTLTKE